MPTTHGVGSPNQQLYSLFPKKKKGSKKNEELEEGVSPDKEHHKSALI